MTPRPNPGDLILCGDGKYRTRQEIDLYLLEHFPPDDLDGPDEVYGPPTL